MDEQRPTPEELAEPLLPCPFCGGEASHIGRPGCEWCEVSQPTTERWNRRAKLAPVEQEAKVCSACKGTGWNYGAQCEPSKAHPTGWKTIKCDSCDYWEKHYGSDN